VINTGAAVEVASKSIGSDGGVISFSKAEDLLDGLKLEIPAGAYDRPIPFKVSYKPIKSHTFNKYFTPASPLIVVENGGAYASDFIELTVPVKVPEGHFAMGFYYDSNRGTLEGIPPVNIQADSVTLVLTHFSQVVVGTVDRKALPIAYETNFKPGVDDWQFDNWIDYIETEGSCAGMSLSAIWYYWERPDGANTHLYGTYDNNRRKPATPQFWQDDSDAVRMTSEIQLYSEDIETKLNLKRFRKYGMAHPDWVWETFRYAIAVSDMPQLIGAWQGGKALGHAMVVYKYDAGGLYVADPNWHGGTTNKIIWNGTGFNEYRSASSAADLKAGKSLLLNVFAFEPPSEIVSWSKLSQFWQDFKNGSTGSHFPSYQLEWFDAKMNPVPVKDQMTTSQNVLKVRINKDSGCDLMHAYLNFESIGAGKDVYTINLRPGQNDIGLLVEKWKNLDSYYVDFRRFTVNCNITPTPTKTPTPTPTPSPTTTPTKPAPTPTSSPTQPSGLLAQIQQSNQMMLNLNGYANFTITQTNASGQTETTTLKHSSLFDTIPPGYGSARTGIKGMLVTWSGQSFSGSGSGGLYGWDDSYKGPYTDHVEGSVSADGKTLQTLNYTRQSARQTMTLSLKNMPFTRWGSTGTSPSENAVAEYTLARAQPFLVEMTWKEGDAAYMRKFAEWEWPASNDPQCYLNVKFYKP
jgi:hypothetical protein